MMRSIALLLFLSIAGCSKDKKDIKFCDPGYQGESCTIEWRAKFLGTYNAASCGVGHTLTVEKSSDLLAIRIFNFANLGDTAIATLTDSSHITIASQVVAGKSVSGSGSITENYLLINALINGVSCSIGANK